VKSGIREETRRRAVVLIYIKSLRAFLVLPGVPRHPGEGLALLREAYPGLPEEAVEEVLKQLRELLQ